MAEKEAKTQNAVAVPPPTVPPPTVPLVVDGKDQEVKHCYFKIVSRNQQGDAPGHYLKVEGRTLTALGTGTESESTFKIYSSFGDSNAVVDILACQDHGMLKVVAVKRDGYEYSVHLKDLEREALDKLTNFKDVKESMPEILFERICKPGSEFCHYKSVLNGCSIILGFDGNGRVMDPTKVEPYSDQATLKIHLAPV